MCSQKDGEYSFTCTEAKDLKVTICGVVLWKIKAKISWMRRQTVKRAEELWEGKHGEEAEGGG